jgi:hypothetical protein
VGPKATVPGFKPVQTESVNSNTFKFISNNFKFDLIKNSLPKLKKIEIKYSCEGFEERNNFLHDNLFSFETDFELKI